MSEFLYILIQRGQSRFKIGISKVPSSRVHLLKSVHGDFDEDSTVFEVNKSARALELYLHTRFDEDRLRHQGGDGGTEFFDTECLDDALAFIRKDPLVIGEMKPQPKKNPKPKREEHKGFFNFQGIEHLVEKEKEWISGDEETHIFTIWKLKCRDDAYNIFKGLRYGFRTPDLREYGALSSWCDAAPNEDGYYLLKTVMPEMVYNMIPQLQALDCDSLAVNSWSEVEQLLTPLGPA